MAETPGPPPMPGSQPSPQPEQQVVYVKAAGNGMATASMVLGIVGVIFGLIPLTFVVAWICGILAIIFGVMGRKRGSDPQAGGKTRATWGLVLGIIAVGLGILGVAIVNDAFSDLEKELEELGFALRALVA